MRKSILIAAAAVILLTAYTTARPQRARAEQPRVEVVFCLDTTGSMGDLIAGAKMKIWSIANEIVSGEPTPHVFIGLVGYRDIGDEYVTMVHPLSDDLDAVYDQLQAFRAEGGGDTPEHVNKALHDAVNDMAWSSDDDTLKLIFLVGDCPPHMDYNDGYDYRVICKTAAGWDIIINTVQCGVYQDTVDVWKDIARRAEGRYAMIDQSGGMEFIDTPYDEELAELNRELEETVVVYGSREEIALQKERVRKMEDLAAPSAAERADYRSKGMSASGSYAGARDLVDDYAADNSILNELDKEELPEEMQSMDRREQARYLEEKHARRTALLERIRELSDKRSAYLDEQMAQLGGDGFDQVVREIIQEQGAAKGFTY